MTELYWFQMSGEQNPINLQGVKKVQEDTSKGVKGNLITFIIMHQAF